MLVVKLKRDKTPRDVVTQALYYASWVQSLGNAGVEMYSAENNDD